jgi:hypothetical protein
VAASHIADLLRQARFALHAGELDRAADLATRALELARGRSPASQEHTCRHLLARCHDERGDAAGALRLHRENARRGSKLEETYQRLAFLGERCGDLEAVRVGTAWLQEFAGEFGLVDVKAQRRLERVERRAAPGTFGPARAEGDGAPSGGVAKPSDAGGAGCVVAAAVAWGAFALALWRIV